MSTEIGLELGDLISNYYENGIVCAVDPIIVMKTNQNFYVPVSLFEIIHKAYEIPPPSIKADLLKRIVEYVKVRELPTGS